MMKKSTLAIALMASISGFSYAGGILLHEVATFDSVSSAGVGNSSNRIDASATMTSPAGLTSIEDSSFSLGASIWMLIQITTATEATVAFE